jgi:hypothetical protein
MQLMLKPSKSYLLLYLIVAFSFIYRIFLMLRETFPPGADIGLHNSIIHSITQSGNTNFLWNYYHIGGGVSLTFPGYHIFVSFIILITGLPDYLAQAFVASLFSSIISLVAFLIARKVWNTPVALIVAFLVAFSRFDIEMLMWGGYPNIIALMLIPLTFYFFLQKEKISLPSFLVVTSLLSSAIFLTHSLSAVIFVAVTFFTFIFVTVFSNRFTLRRTHLLIWILPLILGAIIISPFLVDVAPVFLSTNTGTFSGGSTAVRLALLTTQSVSLDFIYPLLLCVFFIFLFTRKYHGRFSTVPALLLSLWVLIPAIGTQGYLLGFYTDYNRFRYFVYLPLIITFGLVIDYASGFLAKIPDIVLSKVKTMPKISRRITKTITRLQPLFARKPLYVIFVLVFLLFSLLNVSIFLIPSEGIKMQSFYQVMNDPLYETMQWAQNYTKPNAVFAADATFGWWFSGFAQRPTLSGSEPQYLILPREFEPTENVRNILDTDYIIDNGLIQIREDGGYIARHNPLFLAKLNNSNSPYDFFHFGSDEITVLCREGKNTHAFDLSQLTVKEMRVENASNYANVIITRGNEFFNSTQTTTVYQGVKFANMSITLETDRAEVQLDWARFILHTKYAQLYKEENSIALVDTQMNVMGQLIFTLKQPQTTKVFTAENPSSIELLYNLESNPRARIELFVGVFQLPQNYLDSNQSEYIKSLMSNDTKSYTINSTDLPIDIFNYQTFLQDSNISYIMCRNAGALPRFVNDPTFSLVFSNNAIAIFRVKGNGN